MMESRIKAFILLLTINIPSIICETVTDTSCNSDSTDCYISCTSCPSELHCPTSTDCDTCIIDCNDKQACDSITIYTHSCSNVTINCDAPGGNGANADTDVVTGSTIYTPTNFGDITLNTKQGKGCFDEVSIISPADSGSVVLNCDGTNTVSLECTSIDINATYATNFAMICSNGADCSAANVICPDNDYMVDGDWGSTSCYIGCDDNSPDCTSQTIITGGVNDYTQSLTFECSESGVCSSSTITCDIGTCNLQYINNEWTCYGDCGATYAPTNEPSPLPTVMPSAPPTTTGSSGSGSGSNNSGSSGSGDSSGYVIAIVVISCICFIGCIGGILFMLFHSKQSNEKLKEMSKKIDQLAKNDGSNKHPEFDEIPGSSQQSPRYDSNDTGDTAAAAMHTGTSVYGRPSGIAHGGEGGEGGEGGRASNINAEDLEGIGIHGGNNVTGWVPNGGGGGMAIDEEVDDDDDDDAKMGGNKQNNSDNNKKDNNRHSNHFSDGLKNIGAGLNSLEVDLIDQMNEDKETPQGQGNDDGYDNSNDNINRNSNIKPHAIVFDDNDNENENENDNKDDHKDDSKKKKKNKNNNDNNKNNNNNNEKNKGNDEINTKGYDDDDNDDKNKNENKLNGRTNTDDIMATPGDEDEDDDGGGPGYSAHKSPSNESVKRQRLESDVSMMDDEDGVDTIQ